MHTDNTEKAYQQYRKAFPHKVTLLHSLIQLREGESGGVGGEGGGAFVESGGWRESVRV